MKKIAVIVAGGSGHRMGSDVPKQFLMLNGKPLLAYTIRAFVHSFEDIEIILVLPSIHCSQGQEIIKAMNVEHKVQITPGGATRFHSVQNGLRLIDEPAIVFVHDGVRCLVKPDLINRCYQQAVTLGSAIPAITPTDSLRMKNKEDHFVIDRTEVFAIQTPQTFRSEILLPAFMQPYQPSFTDEATVVEAAGNKVCLIEGDYDNLKITRPIDLCIAEKILEERATF